MPAVARRHRIAWPAQRWGPASSWASRSAPSSPYKAAFPNIYRAAECVRDGNSTNRWPTLRKTHQYPTAAWLVKTLHVSAPPRFRTLIVRRRYQATKGPKSSCAIFKSDSERRQMLEAAVWRPPKSCSRIWPEAVRLKRPLEFWRRASPSYEIVVYFRRRAAETPMATRRFWRGRSTTISARSGGCRGFARRVLIRTRLPGG